MVGASVVSDDFIIGLFGKNMPKKTKEIVGRVTILAIGVISVVMALNPPDLIYTLIMFAIAIVMPLFQF